ncbi:MAG TPA: hypothetical protein DCZ95_04065 [Verrucomicrobia bacterium]|nr:MAG: hypothetical protein A2X46_15350 [Lentisphaerae bacterium GWF2_57_35]HBA83251.1 hypothetical protein [Verrucomicrobiota bacterium]
MKKWTFATIASITLAAHLATPAQAAWDPFKYLMLLPDAWSRNDSVKPTTGVLATRMAAETGRITSDGDLLSTGYNRNMNLLFACASEEAYQDLTVEGRTSASGALRKEGFSELRVIAGADGGLGAVVMEKKLSSDRRVLAIGFKGTCETFDLIYDGYGYLTSFPGGSLQVHSGFKSQMDQFVKVEPTVRTSDGFTLNDFIYRESQKPAAQRTRFILYGHSLGGASAKLYGALLADRGMPVTVYTFGAPPVSQQPFVNAYKGKMALYEFYHPNDPVAQLVGALTTLGSGIVSPAFSTLTHFPGRYYYHGPLAPVFAQGEAAPDFAVPTMHHHNIWKYILYAEVDRAGNAGRDARMTAASMNALDVFQ